MPSWKASGSDLLRLGVLAAFFLAAPGLYADHRDSFKEGMEALDRKQWAAVASAMREAIRQEPEEGERIKLYGMRFEVYIPSFYLGLALYEQGDCAGAIEAWKSAERQGKVKGSQLSDLESKRDDCRSRLPTTPPPPPPPKVPTPPPPPPAVDTAKLTQTAARAEAGIATAQNEAKNAAALSRNSDFASLFRSSSPLGRSLKQADDDLSAARQALSQGRDGQDLDALQRALSLAEKATGSYRDLQAEARKQQRAIERTENAAEQAGALRAELIPIVAGARRQLDTQDQGAAAAVLGARRDLEGAVRAYDALGAGADIDELRSLRDRLQSNAAALETARKEAPAIEPDVPIPPPPTELPPTTGGAPPQLRNAADAFFQARFDEVVSLLGDEISNTPREQAAAHLLRAAARFALYRESLATDEALEQAARQDIATCRRLNPNLQPDPAYFSPAFTAFFDAVR